MLAVHDRSSNSELVEWSEQTFDECGCRDDVVVVVAAVQLVARRHVGDVVDVVDVVRSRHNERIYPNNMINLCTHKTRRKGLTLLRNKSIVCICSTYAQHLRNNNFELQVTNALDDDAGATDDDDDTDDGDRNARCRRLSPRSSAGVGGYAAASTSTTKQNRIQRTLNQHKSEIVSLRVGAATGVVDGGGGTTAGADDDRYCTKTKSKSAQNKRTNERTHSQSLLWRRAVQRQIGRQDANHISTRGCSGSTRVLVGIDMSTSMSQADVQCIELLVLHNERYIVIK